MHYQSLRYEERKIGKNLTSTDPLPPQTAESVLTPDEKRSSGGGTQSVFGLLGGEKGYRILSAMINQM